VDGCIKCWSPVNVTRQLEIQVDPRHFLPLSVGRSAIEDVGADHAGHLGRIVLSACAISMDCIHRSLAGLK